MSHAPPQPSDLISELLTGMRLHGVQYRRIQTGPTFGLGFPPKPGHAYFHYLAVGTAILRGADGSQHLLSAGDVVLLPAEKATRCCRARTIPSSAWKR